MPDRSEIISYYKLLIQQYSQYHNHKEAQAWLGAALELTLCGMFFTSKIPVNIFTGCSIIFGTTLIFCFVRNQLILKDQGGAISSAATDILTSLLVDNNNNLQEYLDKKIVSVPSEQTSTFLIFKVKCKKTDKQSEDCLPEKLINFAKKYEEIGFGKMVTRTMMLGIVVFTPLLTFYYQEHFINPVVNNKSIELSCIKNN
jgi:hypothetical protein